MTDDHSHNHDHPHEHHHGHHHDHASGSRKSLLVSLVMVTGFMLVEAVGGWYTNSLALLSDAGHMLTDAGALGLSLWALKIGEKTPSASHTFGYRRFEIMAALMNGLALWAIVGVILHEAYTRLKSPPQVMAEGMIVVAAVGLIVNLISIRMLHAHKDENLNVRGAFLHVLADSLGSVGALTAGLVILYTGWQLVDPLISLFICLLILWSSWGIVKDAVHILLLGVPAHIEYQQVEEEILRHEGVCCLYDLHIWSITSGQEAVSVHVVVPDGFTRRQELLQELIKALEQRFGITHATIQIEESHGMKEQRQGTICRVDGAAKGCAYPAGEDLLVH